MSSGPPPLRVLHVCPELPSADKPGSMAPAARQIESLSNLGITTRIVDMRGIPKLKYLLAIPKIRKLAREVDVIHAHFGYCGWLAWISTRLMKNRPAIVMSFMGDDLLGTPKADGSLEWPSRVQAWINRRFARRMDSVIVKSEEMAGKISSCPSQVIPNGVDMNTFRPISKQEARSRLNWESSGRYVLFPGNPENPRKGYALARAAVDFAQEKIGERIELVPLWNVVPDDVALYMNACDVMLMVSLIEGSPNVVKEAMACNLNVIGVEVGDVPQLLSNVSGCCVCARDSEEIGGKLAEQLTAPVACSGREALESRGLSLDSVARQIRNIYLSAVARRGGL
jgi:glycosyltransferase involved in cell wall biosynthesis